MNEEVKWVEVWIEDAISLRSNILILRATQTGKFDIYDQFTDEVIKSFDNYKEAAFWLNEDEYERVLGRIPSDISDTDNDGYFNELIQRAMQIREKFGDYELANSERKWTREDVMMGFVGDVGDLAKLVMAHQNIRNIPDKQAKLEHELADCLWSIMVLSKMYDIDLESAFLKTTREIEDALDEQKNGS